MSVLEPGNFIAGTNIFNEAFVNSQVISGHLMIINGHLNDHQLEFLHQAELMWGSMDEEVKTTYGKSYFDQKVQRGKLSEKYFTQ